MAHDLAVYAAIGGIVSLTAIALVIGVADGALAAAIAALATLGGIKLAQGAVGNSQG